MRRSCSQYVSTALTLAYIELSSSMALADVVDEKARAMTVEQLKSNYLACSQRALCGELSHGETAICSIIYEELKLRVFGGDFDRLVAWSKSQEHPLEGLGARAQSSCTDDQQAIKVRQRT